jgi:hypothetical protein
MDVDFVCSSVQLFAVTNTLKSPTNDAGLESIFILKRTSSIYVIHNGSGVRDSAVGLATC